MSQQNQSVIVEVPIGKPLHLVNGPFLDCLPAGEYTGTASPLREGADHVVCLPCIGTFSRIRLEEKGAVVVFPQLSRGKNKNT